jgi:hypothetical protein
VHALTVGEVQVRPKNIASTGTPMLWWTLTARTWSPWLPVLATTHLPRPASPSPPSI